MISDPKWRVIARKSQTTVPEVVSVSLCLLTSASDGDDRGMFTITTEDVAACLDMDEGRVVAILDAMQGRFIEGQSIINWEKRQPKREDGAAERAKAWRERKRTQTNANERPDTDTDTDTEKKVVTSVTTRQPPKQKATRNGNPSRSLSEIIADNNGAPPAEWGEWANQEFGWDGERISAEWNEFGPDFWLTDNCRKYDGGRKADWFATWRNHCRKASKRGGSGRPSGKASGGLAGAMRASLVNRYGAVAADSILRGGAVPEGPSPDGSGAFNPDGSPVIPF